MPNNKLLGQDIFRKNICITGAGGSIGSDLCRQIINLKPNNIILFDNSENNLYKINQELITFNEKFSNNIIPVLGNVAD